MSEPVKELPKGGRLRVIVIRDSYGGEPSPFFSGEIDRALQDIPRENIIKSELQRHECYYRGKRMPDDVSYYIEYVDYTTK